MKRWQLRNLNRGRFYDARVYRMYEAAGRVYVRFVEQPDHVLGFRHDGPLAWSGSLTEWHALLTQARARRPARRAHQHKTRRRRGR